MVHGQVEEVDVSLEGELLREELVQKHALCVLVRQISHHHCGHTRPGRLLLSDLLVFDDADGAAAELMLLPLLL